SKQWSILNNGQKYDLQDLTQIQIVMLGASWASRSSAGNLILGKESFEVGGPRTTVCCNVKNAALDEKLLTVVDTPGWYYNYPVEKTPEMDKLEIRRSVHLCAPGPNAILLTIPIAISYDRTVHTAVEEHMSLLGEKVWNHTIVLFTWGDCLGDTTIEERIEKEDKHLELLTEKCGNRYHVFNCKNHTDRTQVTELLEKIEEIMMENNNSHYTLTEETWKKHEDELIERMLEVAVADLDAESKQPFARRRGSFSYSIPSCKFL
uniref:AIG1-type G domain-containing protein n=1 Tax=Sinocyclocheilus anshuiensis TaxID=1608454 RepID=A0A671Q3I2_9TELE